MARLLAELIESTRAASASLTEAAMKEIEAGRDRPYYEADADESNRDDYYSSIDSSSSGQELYERLRDLLEETHEEQPLYKPRVEVYPWVDLRPNRLLQSIYSGEEYTPEDLVQRDAEIDERRLEALKQVSAEGVSANQLDEIEERLPYNCEHVVPQSWFDKLEPMRGDLHHLFSCEMRCNSYRNNIPYGLVFAHRAELGWEPEKCGQRNGERTSFQPVQGRGVAARASLYFLLRYPGEIDAIEAEYLPDRMSLLLEWHDEFEVDEYELHRNAAIFERQGNRNPLIDFPDWAERIDFTLGLAS